MTINIMSWVISYSISCWLIYPILLVALKYFLQTKNELTPEFEIGLDHLMLYWKVAPLILPFILGALLTSAIKKLNK